jgi:hypothetical protein
MIWCGQPSCLRLLAAEIAYTPEQAAFQRSRGVADPLLAAPMRMMRTPLPQSVPPPPPENLSADLSEQLPAQPRKEEQPPQDESR